MIILKMQAQDQQHQHHLNACQTSKFTGCTPELLNLPVVIIKNSRREKSPDKQHLRIPGFSEIYVPAMANFKPPMTQSWYETHTLSSLDTTPGHSSILLSQVTLQHTHQNHLVNLSKHNWAISPRASDLVDHPQPGPTRSTAYLPLSPHPLTLYNFTVIG